MADHLLTLSTGRKLGYAEYGDPKGVPLFFLHGWPSSRLQGEALDLIGKKRGLRVIAPDRPGIGLSEFQPKRVLLDWPDVFRELAASVGAEKFYLVGVSGGAPYCHVLAHAMPERILGVGVLCGAPPLKVTGTDGLMWTYKLGLWANHRLPWALTPGLRAARWFMTEKPTDWPIRGLIAKLGAMDREALSDPYRYNIVASSGREGLRSKALALSVDGDVYSSDWGFDLSGIQIPVHLWHGDADMNIPIASARVVATLIPKAVPRWFAGDGHYSLPLLRSEMLIDTLLAETRL